MDQTINAVSVLTGFTDSIDESTLVSRLLGFFENRDARAILTIAQDVSLRKYYENAILFLANQLPNVSISYEIKIAIVNLFLRVPFSNVTTEALVYSATELYRLGEKEMVRRILNRFTLLVSAHPMGAGLPSMMSNSDLILDGDKGASIVNALVLYLVNNNEFLDMLANANEVPLDPVFPPSNTLIDMLSKYRKSYKYTGF